MIAALKKIFGRKPASLRVVLHPHTENRRDFTMFPGDTMHIPFDDKVWFAEWCPYDMKILQMQVIAIDDLQAHMKSIAERRVAEAILDDEAIERTKNG